MDSGIDVTFSGSTTVFCYIVNTTIWCANIGDSRAIICKNNSPSTNNNNENNNSNSGTIKNSAN